MTIFDADYLGLLSSGVLSASGTSQAIPILGYKGREQQEETNSAYNSDPVIGKAFAIDTWKNLPNAVEILYW